MLPSSGFSVAHTTLSSLTLCILPHCRVGLFCHLRARRYASRADTGRHHDRLSSSSHGTTAASTSGICWTAPTSRPSVRACRPQPLTASTPTNAHVRIPRQCISLPGHTYLYPGIILYLSPTNWTETRATLSVAAYARYICFHLDQQF